VLIDIAYAMAPGQQGNAEGMLGSLLIPLILILTFAILIFLFIRSQPKKGFFSYYNLRILFIIGYSISFILNFIPSFRIKGSFFQPEKLLSVRDIVKILFGNGQVALGMFSVLLVAFAIVFVILAIKYPKRWVFVSGASFGVFGLFLSLFVGTPEGVEVLVIPAVISYIANAMILSGFFIKPEVHSKVTLKTAFCNQCGAKISPDDTFCSECGHSLK